MPEGLFSTSMYISAAFSLAPHTTGHIEWLSHRCKATHLFGLEMPTSCSRIMATVIFHLFKPLYLIKEKCGMRHACQHFNHHCQAGCTGEQCNDKDGSLPMNGKKSPGLSNSFMNAMHYKRGMHSSCSSHTYHKAPTVALAV